MSKKIANIGESGQIFRLKAKKINRDYRERSRPGRQSIGVETEWRWAFGTTNEGKPNHRTTAATMAQIRLG